MTFFTPDPAWPVLVLAVIQFGDGLLCVKPVTCAALIGYFVIAIGMHVAAP